MFWTEPASWGKFTLILMAMAGNKSAAYYLGKF